MQNLINQKFGRLTVVEMSPNKTKGISWICQCDCGNTKEATTKNLKRKHAMSCGCLIKEGNNRKHGFSDTRTHNIWIGLFQRCYNENCPAFKWYGGRGIKICDRWIESFENFLNDMGECPKNLTLDRHPNKNGNYEPENCRWATMKEQARNTRANINITYDGKTQCIAAWAEELNIKHSTLIGRLEKWSLERALTTPKM